MPPTLLRAALLLPALASPAQAQAFPYSPAQIGDGWSSAAPAEAGFDPPRLTAAVAGALDGRMNLHGLVVARHGRLVAEAYRAGEDKGVYSLFARNHAFGPAVRHDTRSVGKSVIGLLVGIAQADGKLGPLSTPALDGFPEFKDLQTPDRRAITLEHLLAMSSGLDWQEGGPGRDDEHKLYWKWTPAYYVLSRPIAAAPGTRWTYNSGGCLLLADLIERATGTPLKAYVQTRLFGPLGITDWEWVGTCTGGPWPSRASACGRGTWPSWAAWCWTTGAGKVGRSCRRPGSPPLSRPAWRPASTAPATATSGGRAPSPGRAGSSPGPRPSAMGVSASS